MTHYFTLNPQYKRYELGFANLEADTLRRSTQIDAALDMPEDNSRDQAAIIIFGILVFVVCFVFVTQYRQDGSFGRMFLSAVPSLCAITIVFIGAGFLLNVTGVLPSSSRLTRLQKHGILIDGQVLQAAYRIDYAPALETTADRTARLLLNKQRIMDATRSLVIDYEFTTADGKSHRGRQSRVMDKQSGAFIDWEKFPVDPPPAPGTPIRVLYADDKTYVML